MGQRRSGTSLRQGARPRHVDSRAAAAGRPRALRSWSVAGNLWLGSRRSWSGVGGPRERRAHLSLPDRSHRPAFRSVGFADAPGLTQCLDWAREMGIAWGSETPYLRAARVVEVRSRS